LIFGNILYEFEKMSNHYIDFSHGMVYCKGEGDKMMKKALLWGAAICAMLLFMGCPADDSPDEEPPAPDGPKTPAGWTQGIDLSVTEGDNPGEIKYTFTATIPAADSYELCYIKGAKNKADEITTGTKITPALSGVISGLEEGETYSVVVVARKAGLEDAISGVKQSKAADLTKIKITGIPLTTMSDGTTPNEDGVTFMLVLPLPMAGQSPLAYGFAVIDGELPPGGGGIAVAEIKQDDGTAETALYDSGQALIFLMSVMTGIPGNLPATKSISGAGTVRVNYAKVSDGDDRQMPKNARVWTNVTFKDPLVLPWNEGVGVDQ
jgi:hypothetical protein